MKQDEIIEMAREVGIIHPEKVDAILVRFAALVEARTIKDHAMYEVQRLGQEIEAQTQEQMLDLMTFGVSWSKDGKRIDPSEVYLEPKAEKQKPVAYLCENGVGHKYFRWKKPSNTYKPIALYTIPPQRQHEPCPFVVSTREGTHHCSLSHREPLTLEQRKKILNDNTVEGYHGDYFDAWGIVDDVEAAHGIKGEA